MSIMSTLYCILGSGPFKILFSPPSPSFPVSRSAYELQVVSFFRHPEIYQKIAQRYQRGVRPQLRCIDYMYTHVYLYIISILACSILKVEIHVIVVSWFLQCMGCVPCEGCMYFQESTYSTRAVLSRAP